MERSGIKAPNALYICSIDFGTKGAGFAITRKTADAHDLPLLYESWRDQPEGTRYPKDLTVILYRGSEPIAIGWHARTLWLKLDDDTRSSHTYVEAFKLALQDPERAGRLPAWLKPEKVVGDYLFLLRHAAMEVFERVYAGEPTPPCEDIIQWCLTVPAMWDEASKQAMRRAALRAGLITRVDSDHLTIILEPEAAALHALVHKAPPLQAGMMVMVVDAGGGTTDVTVHEVHEVGSQAVLKEAVRTQGALCGGVLVDEAFRLHLRSCVGAGAFDTWAARRPGELAVIMDKWEAIKCGFRAPTPAGAAPPAAVPDAGGPSTSSGASTSTGQGAQPQPSVATATATSRPTPAAATATATPGGHAAGGSGSDDDGWELDTAWHETQSDGHAGEQEEEEEEEEEQHEGDATQEGAEEAEVEEEVEVEDGSEFEELPTSVQVTIPLPKALQEVMTPATRSHLADMQGGLDSVLVLDADTIQLLFSGAVDAIITLVSDQLRAVMDTGMSLSMVLLVGGFARSPYLEARVRQAVQPLQGAHLQVVVPQNPHIAVLSGAVIYGSHPEWIHARCSKLTYGVRACGPHTEGAPSRFWHSEEGCFYTDAYFHRFVEANQQVGYDQEVVHYYEPLYKNQRQAVIDLMASDKAPDFIQPGDRDVYQVGSLMLSLGGDGYQDTPPSTSRDRLWGDTKSDDSHLVRVRLRFGATEVTATAEDVKTRRERQVTLKFSVK